MGFKSLFLPVFLFSHSALVVAETYHSEHSIVVSATRSEQSTVTTPASISIIDEQEIGRRIVTHIDVGQTVNSKIGNRHTQCPVTGPN